MQSQQLRPLKSLLSNKYIVEIQIAVYENFAAKFILSPVKYLDHTDNKLLAIVYCIGY